MKSAKENIPRSWVALDDVIVLVVSRRRDCKHPKMAMGQGSNIDESTTDDIFSLVHQGPVKVYRAIHLAEM